uniref:CUB domain-containing protein n=1 Tax=Ascaris lumbricoides TaxID=6252 RepID=A0A0M3HMS8_ASCLU
MAARSSNFKCKKGIGDGSATADAFEHESGDHVSLCSVLNDVVPFHIDGSYSPQLYALRPAAYPSSTFPYDTEGQQCTWAQSDTQIFDNKFIEYETLSDVIDYNLLEGTLLKLFQHFAHAIKKRGE